MDGSCRGLEKKHCLSPEKMDQIGHNFSFDLELQASNTGGNSFGPMSAKADCPRKEATWVFMISSNEAEPKRTEVEQIKSRS